MRVAVSILLLLLFVPGWMGEAPRIPLGRSGVITARRVALYPDDPSWRRTGDFLFLGGVELSSRDPGFGGFSALAVDGDRFVLLSDGGQLVRLRLSSAGAVGDVRFGRLPAGPGTGWQKRDRDAESLARDPATGDWLVGFENSNSFWRYTPDFTRTLGHAAPPVMSDWVENLGAEAFVPWRGGYVALQEMGKWPYMPFGRGAVRFAGDPVTDPARGFRFGYLPPDTYSPSDAAVLPNGDLLVLNRKLKLPFGWSTAISRVPAAEIRPGHLARGKLVAQLSAPLLHDNFEGIAVTYEGRRAIVWLVSDDNQSLFQRTLLLKFRYPDGDAAR